MCRTLVCMLVTILLPLASVASPYPVYYFEDFEDGELDYGFHCPDLVDEPPGDPTQSYALIDAPSWDGTFGLFLFQGVGDAEPHISVTGCHVCGLGTVEFKLGAPPGRTFGAVRLRVEFYMEDPLIYEYDEPGFYSIPTPEIVYVEWFTWEGHDVIVDDLWFHDHCDCGTPNAEESWGRIKAAYR
ncbi:hypothetical protein H8E07_11010 [bacterium]|nr:hypothetical protein [bacterium]